MEATIRFLKEPTIVATWVSALILAVAALLMWELGPNNSIGLMHLKVVNDMHQTVKIQPCWDLACRHTSGLRTVLLRPGERMKIHGDPQFENDMPQLLTIAVQKPSAGQQDFEGCVMRGFEPQTKIAVFRVARQTIMTCPTPNSGGGGG